MRLPLVALLLLLAALPARAGELIRYRTPDGSVGFVDDEKRLPPGVEVLSRSPLEPAAPRPPAPAPAPAAPDPAPAAATASSAPASAEPAPAAAADADAADCAALGNLLLRTRCRGAQEARCARLGLSPRCSPAQVADAESWCARGEALRQEIAHVDDERDAARERYAECQGRGVRPDCERDELDEAERAALVAERRVQALEDQCHDEGCLPGWVREGCEPEPGA